MSLGILYLGLFAVLDPWFSANILLSDKYQVCKYRNYNAVLHVNVLLSNYTPV